MSLESLQYPIGKANIPEVITTNHIAFWIEILDKFPEKLERLIAKLNDAQLDTAYREGGWTVRQVIHHLFDSHSNSYVRFKWTLTEDEPVIKAYYEDRWAELIDSRDAPVEMALTGLSALHKKWVFLVRHLDETQLKRCFVHPEGNKRVSLEENIGIYAWHSEHHYAHLENLMKREGWI